MLDVAARLEQTVARFVRELPETRGRVTLNYDQDGQAHLKGATDTGRYTVKRGDRIIEVKGRTIDPLHSAAGYTSQDVSDLRGLLKAQGVTLSLAECEGALLEAVAKARTQRPAKTAEQKRADARKKKARQRERARANGICVKCCTNVAKFRTDGSQCATCATCQQQANAAKKRTQAA